MSPPRAAPKRTETDVILDFAFEDGLLFVELRNLGAAPALKVRCTFDKEFHGLGGSRTMNELRQFRALEFLAPGRSIRTLLDTSAAYFARKEPTRLTATIEYRTPAGEKRGGAILHDLSVFRELAYVPKEEPTMPDEAPYRNFNFRVEIDGLTSAGFAEVEIPDATIEAVEYREGTDQVSSVRKLPGRVRYGNVVLRRGVSQDLDLWAWFRAVRDGDLQRRNGAIVLQDASHQDVRRWLVRDAWPVRYAGPTLSAKGNEVVIEEIELACEGIELDAMLRRLATSVAGIWRGILAIVRPQPDAIQLLTIRGDTPVGAQPVQAGATHAWRDTIAVATDGVLLVTATVTVEHGTGPLDDGPDTNVELALLVDGARIARAVETVRRGDDRTIVCSSPILVREGVREVRATLRPADAGILLGDATVSALFVPESQASIVLRR